MPWMMGLGSQCWKRHIQAILSPGSQVPNVQATRQRPCEGTRSLRPGARRLGVSPTVWSVFSRSTLIYHFFVGHFQHWIATDMFFWPIFWKKSRSISIFHSGLQLKPPVRCTDPAIGHGLRCHQARSGRSGAFEAGTADPRGECSEREELHHCHRPRPHSRDGMWLGQIANSWATNVGVLSGDLFGPRWLSGGSCGLLVLESQPPPGGSAGAHSAWALRSPEPREKAEPVFEVRPAWSGGAGPGSCPENEQTPSVNKWVFVV